MRSIHFRCRRFDVAPALGVCALSAWSLPVAAQSSTAPTPTSRNAEYEARALTNEGLHDFDAGQHRAALEKFESAYRLFPVPGLLYDMAQAARLLGDCQVAVARYGEFIASAPGAKFRKLAEQRLAELEPCAEKPTAEPSTTGPALATTSSSALLVASAAPSPPARSHAAKPAVKPAPSPPHPRNKLVPAVIGFASSAALLSVSGYYGLRAVDASNHVSDAFDRGATWNSDLSATEAQGKRAQTISWTSLGVSLLAAGVTTCWLVFD